MKRIIFTLYAWGIAYIVLPPVMAWACFRDSFEIKFIWWGGYLKNYRELRELNRRWIRERVEDKDYRW